MGAQLRMYNVEFGDAFLLCGQEENLIVDLGSIQSGFSFTSILDSIRRESANKRLSLLLTHLHKDHWSGLKDQPIGHRLPDLECVYLPDLFGMRVRGKLDVIVCSLLADLLEAVILNAAPRFTLADLLLEVLPSIKRGKVCFLKQGDIFSIGATEYEVLWPRLTGKDVLRRNSPELRAFLEEVEGVLEEMGDGERLWDTVEALRDCILSGVARETGYHLQFDYWPANQSTYETIYERAEGICRRLSVAIERGGKLEEQFGHYAERLKREWNKVSVVFQNREDLERGNLLMTGDVTQSVLNRLVLKKLGPPYLKGHYTIIKAPHHGTTDYFCTRLPGCEHICISNGEGNTAYHRITDQYARVYGCLGKRARLHCTNPRCDYYKHGGPCPCCIAPPQASYEIP